MWRSELIRTARDFLESKYRHNVQSERLGNGCASEASVWSVRMVVSSNDRP